jgi:hypothetical protein
MRSSTDLDQPLRLPDVTGIDRLARSMPQRELRALRAVQGDTAEGPDVHDTKYCSGTVQLGCTRYCRNGRTPHCSHLCSQRQRENTTKISAAPPVSRDRFVVRQHAGGGVEGAQGVGVAEVQQVLAHQLVGDARRHMKTALETARCLDPRLPFRCNDRGVQWVCLFPVRLQLGSIHSCMQCLAGVH